MSFTPEMIKKLTPDQMELLVELGELAKKEEELSIQIDNIRRGEEKVGLARNNRNVTAVHDDEEFVDLLSLRYVREREMIREKIGGIISSLVDAGLGNMGIIKRQAANYGVKF